MIEVRLKKENEYNLATDQNIVLSSVDTLSKM